MEDIYWVFGTIIAWKLRRKIRLSLLGRIMLQYQRLSGVGTEVGKITNVWVTFSHILGTYRI